mmetsp:Transcript_2975/g.9109  ORF Transcript_2975/g.9109 Transcript_2975/m.9109 type:complete len:418 (-) Transcript_2975:700-1953(-)
MGRRKIVIEKIQEAKNRQVTFLKRKKGLLKKARELAVLCDCNIEVVIFGSNGQLYEFHSQEPAEILDRYGKYSGRAEIWTSSGNDQGTKIDINIPRDMPKLSKAALQASAVAPTHTPTDANRLAPLPQERDADDESSDTNENDAADEDNDLYKDTERAVSRADQSANKSSGTGIFNGKPSLDTSLSVNSPLPYSRLPSGRNSFLSMPGVLNKGPSDMIIRHWDSSVSDVGTRNTSPTSIPCALPGTMPVAMSATTPITAASSGPSTAPNTSANLVSNGMPSASTTSVDTDTTSRGFRKKGHLKVVIPDENTETTAAPSGIVSVSRHGMHTPNGLWTWQAQWTPSSMPLVTSSNDRGLSELLGLPSYSNGGNTFLRTPLPTSPFSMLPLRSAGSMLGKRLGDGIVSSSSNVAQRARRN